MTAFQEGFNCLSVFVWVLLKGGHVVRVPDPPELHPPPLHVLAHHRVQPPGGDQAVSLRVDEEHGPGARVLVLHPVSTKRHTRVTWHLPLLPGHQLQVLQQTQSIGFVDAEVSHCQEQSPRRPSVQTVCDVTCPGVVGELSGPWAGVKHWPNDPEVMRLVSDVGDQVLVHGGAVVTEGHGGHTLDPLLGDSIQNRLGERGDAPIVIMEHVLYGKNAWQGFVTQAVVKLRVFVQLSEGAACKAKEKDCKMIRNYFRLLWSWRGIGHFDLNSAVAHSGCW